MPPEDNTPEKSDEENRREAAERAIKANAQRNADRLARMEQIADSAETTGDHKDDEELTDEMWEDHELTEDQRTARAIVRAQEEGGEEEETEERPDRDSAQNDQDEEQRDDEARDAGADDVRVVNGVKEYRLVVNGKEKWATLAQIRATAQKIEAADEYLQTATDTVRRATRAAPSAEEVEEANRKKQERKAHTKALLQRAVMGDEQAIDELTERLDATPSAVTPDVLRTLDERFDSRVTFREAVNWFEDEYADELKHQAMKSYAGELDAALAAEQPGMPPKERLRRVGNQIRKELQSAYGVGRQGQGPSEKARRKAEVRRPEPAGKRQPTKADEDEVEDTSSVIQKIAQGRHQPRAVVHGPIRNR